MSEEEGQDISCPYWRTRAEQAERAELNAAQAALRAREVLETAEADAAALRRAAAHALRALDLAHDEDRLREHLTRSLATDAGRTLLAELDAARALAAWLNDRRHWTIDRCPCCGFGSKLDGSEFHGTGCVLAAYNTAVEGGQDATDRP